MKKRIFAVALASILILSVTGCSSGESGTKTASTIDYSLISPNSSIYLPDRQYGYDSDSATEETTSQPESSASASTSPGLVTGPSSPPATVSGGIVIDSATTGEQNALESANSYLRLMAFSHDGLIDQLEYEGYTTAEATYAANNCGADWNEQALKSAKSYLSHMAFSYTGLIDQLEYEKFTTSQATYAADNCGANWNEQAAKSAESYLSHMSFSRDELISQLEYEGFTHEQAVYGAQANGY